MPKEPYFFIDEEDEKRNEVLLFVRDATPDSWRRCANELRDSAELLWKDRSNSIRVEAEEGWELDENGQLKARSGLKKIYSVSRSYFLLAGFALENLLKGYLVAGNPSLIIDGTLSKDIKTHKLLVLFKKIEDFELDGKESEFCSIAEQAIPYRGRYPVPLAFNSVVPEVGLTDELRQGFLTVYNRLDERLYMKIKDGWDSGVGVRLQKICDPKYDP